MMTLTGLLAGVLAFALPSPLNPPAASLPESTTVTGSITFNGDPVTNRVLVLSAKGNAKSVPIDAEGRYRVELPEGDYMMSIAGFHQTSRVTARTGVTEFDWKMEGATVTALVEHGGSDEARIEITRAHPEFVAFKRLAAGQTQLEFVAIPFGQFRVVARTRSGSSKFVEIDVTQLTRELVVRLELPIN